jgi:uncharacterized membrane protein YedE/YeeE
MSSENELERERPYWNPYVAGLALGLVTLASFVLTGKGIGASGAMKRLGGFVVQQLNPVYAEENANLAAMAHAGLGLLNDWIVFLALGVLVGGAVAAFTARRLRVETVRGPRITLENRWVLAVAGGILSGFAAQLARGCTSGQAVTGGAQLALGSWIFMFAVFGGAYGLAYLVRRQWI